MIDVGAIREFQPTKQTEVVADFPHSEEPWEYMSACVGKRAPEKNGDSPLAIGACLCGTMCPIPHALVEQGACPRPVCYDCKQKQDTGTNGPDRALAYLDTAYSKVQSTPAGKGRSPRDPYRHHTMIVAVLILAIGAALVAWVFESNPRPQDITEDVTRGLS